MAFSCVPVNRDFPQQVVVRGCPVHSLSPFNFLHAVLVPAVQLPTQRSHYPPLTIMEHHQDTKEVQALLRQHEADGYQATWCNTYHSGQKSHVDLIMTNRSDIDTRCMIEVGNKSLSRMLARMRVQGYYLWYISTRLRGRQTRRPTFSLLLKPLPNHLEHVSYLRESEDDYLNHLGNRTRENYTLLSHSFYYLDNKLFASSAYIRDRRLALGIPTEHSPPPRWTSYYDLTLDNFTTTLHKMANESCFLSYIESYMDNTNSLRFAVVFTEQLDDRETWFTWGIDKTTAAIIIQNRQVNWKPVLSLGYDHRGSEEFYLQFVRK